jgi:hypothetical protein
MTEAEWLTATEPHSGRHFQLPFGNNYYADGQGRVHSS